MAFHPRRRQTPLSPKPPARPRASSRSPSPLLLYWLAVAASARGWIPVNVPLTPFGSVAPALAALLLSRFWGGGPGVRELLRSLVRWRVGLALWLVAVLTPPLIAAASLLAARLYGAPAAALGHPGLPPAPRAAGDPRPRRAFGRGAGLAGLPPGPPAAARRAGGCGTADRGGVVRLATCRSSGCRARHRPGFPSATTPSPCSPTRWC